MSIKQAMVANLIFSLTFFVPNVKIVLVQAWANNWKGIKMHKHFYAQSSKSWPNQPDPKEAAACKYQCLGDFREFT